MSTEKLPNTLIIGAAKCGTTSLATALRSHPEVFMPTLKELSHFVEGGGQRVSEFSEYLKYFRSNRNAKIVGEASVAYIWCDSSARWIARDLGTGIKIIALLRSPWNMAYSLWGHMRRLEREPLEFEAALLAESSRSQGDHSLVGWRDNYLYRSRASYAVQIERYQSVFGKNSLRIIASEDMFTNPTNCYRSLCDWLGIHAMDIESFPRENVAGRSRVKGIRRWLDGNSPGKRMLKSILPDSIRLQGRRTFEKVNRRAVKAEPLDEHLKAQLQDEFRPDVERLSTSTGIDFVGKWYSPRE